MSDLHYDHENVISFDKRPFNDVREMNAHIESALAEKIGPGDILFDLGDLFWKPTPSQVNSVLGLAGPKEFYKIMGNHDKSGSYNKCPYVTELYDILEIHVDYKGLPYRLVLSHYPMISWPGKPHGALHLFGHTHGNIDTFVDSRPDLCVDVGFYAGLARKVGSFLISFEDIFQHFEEKAGTIDFKDYTLEKCKEL